MWWGGKLDHVLGTQPRMSKRVDWRHARIHPEDADRVVSSFDAALRSQASSWNAPYRLPGFSGQDIHVREHAYFLRDAAGVAYRAIGTIRDVSALKELLLRERAARAQAEQASLVKDQFLAMLGHELRNPLAPIVTVITLLELRSAGPDKHLQILRRQTEHLVRLVDDLMDVARISTGKVELTKVRTLVEPLLQRAAEMSQPLFEQRRHHLDIDVSADVEIDADIARMTQVLTNLLSNAAKYTEPGGRVRAVVRQEAGQAVIRIRDNGIGIAADFLPKIFEMFSQSHQALDRAQGGLGLGLAIVRNLVHQHGGSVQACSEGLGLGAEMVLRLPLAAEAVAPTALAGPQAIDRQSAPCSILIVDDNQDAATLLGEWFNAQGCRVRIAHHPAQALDLFGQEPPEVALVDIGLPAMDGYELVRRMRALPEGAHSRIVAVTGYGSASDVQKAIAAGFDAHLAKPISLGLLSQLLAERHKAKTAL
nr:ATP-binding protein [Acidovorax sp. D4N7]